MKTIKSWHVKNIRVDTRKNIKVYATKRGMTIAEALADKFRGEK